jgi:hypothetical protein
MTDYVVLFPADDEDEWAAGSEADHQRTYDIDAEFAKRLKELGGSISGGAGLAPSSTARTLRRTESVVMVTDGPYTETAEQISGFYLVTCASYDDLVEAAQVLAQAHPVVEIRPVDND